MSGGVIGVFTRHPTAANLLMVVMIVCGLFALSRLNIQFFPSFGIDWIEVSVEWSGASAEDVDANIVQAIEPEVRFLDGTLRRRFAGNGGVTGERRRKLARDCLRPQAGEFTSRVPVLTGGDVHLAGGRVEHDRRTAVGEVERETLHQYPAP